MSGLYEELGITKDAPLEQIRKAYKKRALQTHPDRLPPNATTADKASSEEKFRRVNNAYEVLSDPKKRAEYDIHGVWPPPEVEEIPASHMPSGSHRRSFYRSHRPSRSQTYPSSFFSHHPSPFPNFEFTDPFVLFNSIFEGTPFYGGPTRHRHPAYPQPMDPFGHMQRIQAEIESFMDDIDRDPFNTTGFPRFGFGPAMPIPPPLPAVEASPFNNNRGRWVSESYMTSTVNGVTQTIRKRVDSDGNEHITRTLPDGREVRTINGIEQPPAGFLPPPTVTPSKNVSENRRIPESSAHRYLPPDSAHSQPMGSASRMPYRASTPPPYSRHSQDYQVTPPTNSQTRRQRSSSEKYYPANTSPDTRLHDERPRKKRWWQ